MAKGMEAMSSNRSLGGMTTRPLAARVVTAAGAFMAPRSMITCRARAEAISSLVRSAT